MTGVEPLVIAGIATAAVGTAVSIYGQLQAGKSAKRAADRNAEILMQEKAANEAARKAEAKFEARKFLIQSGRNEALAAFSGSSGFEDIFIDDRVTFESEQLLKDYNSAVFGVQRESQAQLARFEGQAAKNSATFGAIGTGIGFVSSSLTAAGLSKSPTTLGSTPVSGGGAGAPRASNSVLNSPGL